MRYIHNTRHFLDMAGVHIEGYLYWLTTEAVEFGSQKLPFGGLVNRLLKESVLPEELAAQLLTRLAVLQRAFPQ
jgi:hypothetical protein